MRYYEEVGEGHVCVLSIYYPLNGETFDHELAYACGNIFAPNDNEYVYLGFNLDGTSGLYRFNAASGEQTEYFRGELESLDSISPNGRYAVVVTDNSGQVDTVDLEPYPHNLRVFRDYPEAKLQVFDMETHQFVYEESGSKVSRIEWANTSTMLVASAEASNQPYNLQMVTFGVESTEIKQIPNLALYGLGSEIVRDGHYVFVWTEDDQGVKGMSAFDLNTNHLVPLVLNMLPPNYEVEIGGLVFDNLDIVVRLKNARSSPADAQSIRYTLTLP
jgi:hypothetical protein